MYYKIINNYKDTRDEKWIKTLCENLNTNFRKDYNMNTNFCYFKNKGYYQFYNEFKNNDRGGIEFTFRVHYIKDELLDFELAKIEDDTLLNNILRYKNNLLYIEILALYVSKKGVGVGTNSFKTLLKSIKHIKTLKYIVLMPADEALKFWEKCGFSEDNDTLLKINKKFIYQNSRDVIYVL